jgi:hypothetical protein
MARKARKWHRVLEFAGRMFPLALRNNGAMTRQWSTLSLNSNPAFLVAQAESLCPLASWNQVLLRKASARWQKEQGILLFPVDVCAEGLAALSSGPITACKLLSLPVHCSYGPAPAPHSGKGHGTVGCYSCDTIVLSKVWVSGSFLIHSPSS